jgi:hypothetical protein
VQQTLKGLPTIKLVNPYMVANIMQCFYPSLQLGLLLGKPFASGLENLTVVPNVDFPNKLYQNAEFI